MVWPPASELAPPADASLALGVLEALGDRVEVAREQDGAALPRIVADTLGNLHLVVNVKLVRPHRLLSLVEYARPGPATQRYNINQRKEAGVHTPEEVLQH